MPSSCRWGGTTRACRCGQVSRRGPRTARSTGSARRTTGRSTTISLPAFSGRWASSVAACSAAPDEMPTSRPSSAAARRATFDSRLGVDVDDLVVDRRVEDLGHEVGADALDLVRAGGAAVEDRRLRGLDADDLDAGLAGLEHLADAGDGAAGADARDEDVDLAVGVRPDLLGGGRAVDLGVGLVGELAGQDGARALRDDLVGTVDRAAHALGARGQDQLGAEGAQQALGAPWTWSPASSGRRCSRGPRRRTPARCRCCRWSPRRSCRRA